METFKVVLPHRVVVVDSDDYITLIGLMRNDPLKGLWDKIPHRQRCEILFAKGLIDCYGNKTEDGEMVCQALQDFDQYTLEMAEVEREMKELDRLDDELNKRPNYRQPAEEFNYGE